MRAACQKQEPGHLGVTCQALGGVQGSNLNKNLASPARLRPVGLTSLLAAWRDPAVQSLSSEGLMTFKEVTLSSKM